jgi:hypothetical protein
MHVDNARGGTLSSAPRFLDLQLLTGLHGQQSVLDRAQTLAECLNALLGLVNVVEQPIHAARHTDYIAKG